MNSLIPSFSGIVLRFSLRWCCLWVNILRETPLERTNYDPAGGCQLEIASLLWMGAWVPLPSQHWGSIRLESVQALYMLPRLWIHMKRIGTVVYIRQWDFLYVCLFVLESSTKPLWLLWSFCLLIHIVPWAWRGGGWWRYLIYDWVLQNLSLFAHYPVVGLSISSHLL